MREVFHVKSEPMQTISEESNESSNDDEIDAKIEELV